MDLQKLLEKNEQYKVAFSENCLFRELKDLDKFLDCLQVWSDAFQEMIIRRVRVSKGPFLKLARQHLEEELNHNRMLAEGRMVNGCFDIELKQLCEWFPNRIEELSELERVVLVHLVVEGCASVFYEKITPLFKGHSKEKHFVDHLHADANHDKMGLDLLIVRDKGTYQKLEKIQAEGWSTINLLMSRLSQLS